MDIVRIIKLKDLGDDKGSVVNLDFSELKVAEVPVFYRKAGENPEGHFHKGTDKSVDPQYIYVLEGALEIYCKYPDGTEEVVTVHKIEGIVIPKLVYHRYKTLEKTIFCEPRVERYDSNNVDKIICGAEEYLEILSNLT